MSEIDPVFYYAIGFTSGFVSALFAGFIDEERNKKHDTQDKKTGGV